MTDDFVETTVDEIFDTVYNNLIHNPPTTNEIPYISQLIHEPFIHPPASIFTSFTGPVPEALRTRMISIIITDKLKKTLTLIKHTKDIICLQRKFREWYYMPGNEGYNKRRKIFNSRKY